MLIFLPSVAFGLFLTILRREGMEWRRAFLLTAIAWGTFIAIDTETLSLFAAITRNSVAASWSIAVVAATGALVWRWRRGASPPRVRIRIDIAIICAALAILLLGLAVAAYFSAPNIADALSYHMPRVMHWIQNRSVRHFPTNITRQLHMPPMAEFVVLHFQLLSGSDQFCAFSSWIGYAISVVSVSYIAMRLGAGALGQAIAATAAASVPMAVLQSGSLHNDLPVAGWVVCFVAMVVDLLAACGRNENELIRETASERWTGIVPTGAALGLALLAKSPAYLYVPAFCLMLAIGLAVKLRLRAIVSLVAMATIAMLLNAGHWSRNYRLTGSPLGPGIETWRGGSYRYANEHFTLHGTISNLIRNTATHITVPEDPKHRPIHNAATRDSPSETFNDRVDLFARDLHTNLGWDVNDPDTTWRERGYRFSVRGDWNNEAFAGEPIHFALAALGLILAPILAPRGRRWLVLGFAAAVVMGWVAFSFYLRWQPFHTRLTVALMMVATVLIGITFDHLRFGSRLEILRRIVLTAIALGFVALAVPCALYNDFHPVLVSPPLTRWSIFQTPRIDQYLYSYHGLRKPFSAVADEICRRKLDRIGIDTDGTANEYNLWVLLKQCNPNIEIVNVDVWSYAAPLAKVPPFDAPPPNVVVEFKNGVPRIAPAK